MNAREFGKTMEASRLFLGIELGSTRIKAVLIDDTHAPVASGSVSWENRLEGGYWTYSMEEVWKGLQDCFADVKRDVMEKYGVKLTRVGGIGISAMMHGYLAFDEAGELLAPFRTWRNTTTGQAAEELTGLLNFNIPQRWSIAHLYQAVLNGEAHVPQIRYLTTLAGYVHWKLTGEKVLGVGDASGMFPIDSDACDFDRAMLSAFQSHIDGRAFPWKVQEILPKVLSAGEFAGKLTEEGAKLLDVSGELEAGAPLCPPEGDAGTGMTATNAVAKRTGNVSAGTSVFAMIVLEKMLSRVYTEIDMVTTPSGAPVAMAHCNNCTSDLNAWVGLFGEFAKEMGLEVDGDKLFGTLYRKALLGDKDCGGLMAYNYFAGEPITDLEEGRPLFMRLPDAKFTLANFMRTHLYASLATLRLGMEILLDKEKVEIDRILGHGGLFRTRGVGQNIMAASINTPVSVMETAGEGGAWGIALLSAYQNLRAEAETLEAYLDEKVFNGMPCETVAPDPEDVAGFNAYMEKYVKCLPAERAAVESMR